MDRWWKWLLIFGLLTPSFSDIVPNPTKRKGAGPLFRIHRERLWGFMDRSGKTVIPPRFTEAGDFFSGLAWAREKSKCGYIDLTGRVAIPYQFDECRDFSEGLAAVQAGRGWGFIDATGKFAIAPHWKAVADFHERLARFEEWQTIQCMDPETITTFKEFHLEDAPDYAFMLHDESPKGDLYLEPCRGGRFGFLDHAGNIAIAPAFRIARDFSEGRAAVKTEGFPWGYIDKTGKIVIKPQFDSASEYSEGLASVGYFGPMSRFGYIDSNGTVVIPLRFDFAGDFSEGLAAVEETQSQWGFIDHRGEFVIPPNFASANSFSEGFAVVFSDNILGSFYVDKKGRYAFRGGMNPTWPFVDGLAIVSREKGLVYLNRNGKIVETYEFFRTPHPE